MVLNFFFGFSQYFSGLRFWIQTPKLLRISIIPFLIDLVILTAGIVFSVHKIPQAVNHIVAKPDVWYGFFIYYFVLVLTATAFFIVTVFIMSVCANLVAFPFNDILAERSLILRKALEEKKTPLRSKFQKSLRNLSAMARKTLFYLLVGAVLILTMFIPGLGVVGAFLGAVLLAFDFLDYSFDHFGLRFQERKKFISTHFSCFLGFAAGMGLTMTIPIINVLVMPGNVVAGACLVANLRSKELERSNS